MNMLSVFLAALALAASVSGAFLHRPAIVDRPEMHFSQRFYIGRCTAAFIPVCCSTGGPNFTAENECMCTSKQGTVLSKGFCNAWRMGAPEMHFSERSYIGRCTAAFIPVCCSTGGPQFTAENECMCTSKQGTVLSKGFC